MSTLESLLVNAIEKNDIPTVSSLIEKGVSFDSVPSPLFWATKAGHIEIMTMLLDAGADVNAGSRTQNTACYAACAYQRSDALKLLLERGARINHGSFLKAAATRPKEEVLVLLLDAGAPLDKLTNYDLMNLVATPSSVAVLKRLLARNVNVSALKDIFGRTLCHHVLQAHRDVAVDVDELIRAIVAVGVNVDAGDCHDSTPLHYAAKQSSVRVLVELGADIDRQDDRKLTALHLACGSGTWRQDGPCVQQLLALGANVHLVTNSGETACHLAMNRRTALRCAPVSPQETIWISLTTKVKLHE
jgi:ankyrin repeat protein